MALVDVESTAVSPGSSFGKFTCFFGTVFEPIIPADFRWHSWVAYAVWQTELCPTTGREHSQLYLETSRKLSPATVGAWFKKQHIVGKSPAAQGDCIKYCKKEESRLAGPFEFGSPKPGQGSRTDISKAVDLLKSSKSLKRVATECPVEFVKYHNGFKALKHQLVSVYEEDTERTWKTDLYIYWGVSGAGKSYRSHKEAKNFGGGIYFLRRPAKGSAVWWDGYCGQENVIINDFYGWLNFSEILNLIDEYPHRVEVKGGSLQFMARRVFITSNQNWPVWYRSHLAANPEHVHAFTRRITKCEEMSVPFDEAATPVYPSSSSSAAPLRPWINPVQTAGVIAGSESPDLVCHETPGFLSAPVRRDACTDWDAFRLDDYPDSDVQERSGKDERF